MKTPKRILAPTDLSDLGKAAISCARDYAQLFGAELHLLNVVEDYWSYYPDANLYAAPELACDIETMKASVEQQLAGIELPPDLKVVHAVEFGSPPWGILQYARENDIDMIVISTHGRTGLKHLLLGSVAEKVVRHAPCQVLTVRPEGFTAEDAEIPEKASVPAGRENADA